MKRLLLALPLALSACAGMTSVPASPSAVADATKLDEQAALSVELAYQAAGTAVLTAERAGLVPANAKPAILAADRGAYAAVKAVRAAYDTGNAASYADAVKLARAAVVNLLASFRS